MLGISEHQARTVHVEDRMSGANDLMHRILDAHLTEAQPAELGQGLAHIVQGDSHLVGPYVESPLASGPASKDRTGYPYRSSDHRAQ
jgi:hypothetical protein